MTNTPYVIDLRNPHPSPIAAGTTERQRAVRPPKWQPAANFFRRFDRDAIGFWLGGVALGLGGCILGACMPYHHPVAMTISVLWWGIYCGCLGSALGAMICNLTKRTPAAASQVADGALEVHLFLEEQ